jgi:PAS domain S-box-containing protein
MTQMGRRGGDQGLMGIVTLSEDGRLCKVDPGGERLLGHAAEQLVGMRLLDLVDAEYRAELQRLITDVGGGKRSGFELQARVLKNDGTTAPAALQVRHLAGKRSEPGSLVAVVRQRAVSATAFDDLEALLRVASHDLRAPLRAIDGFSDMLLEDCAEALGAEGERYVDRIQKASRTLARILDDLLLLTRIGHGDLCLREVDLGALANTIADGLRKRQPDRNVSFRITPHERVPLVVAGDEVLLRRLLECLLDNAWKFTGGRRDASVELGSCETDGVATFFVRDNGVGFDVSRVGELFRPFQRLHVKSEFEGAGVGLATVQRAVGRHGGRVWAESAAGGGAALYFTLGP